MKIYRISQSKISYVWGDNGRNKTNDRGVRYDSWQVRAYDGQKIIGALSGTKYYNDVNAMNKPFMGGEYIEIFHQYVDNEYQRQGIASAMYDLVKKKYPNDKFYFGQLTGQGHALVESLVGKGIIELAKHENL